MEIQRLAFPQPKAYLEDCISCRTPATRPKNLTHASTGYTILCRNPIKCPPLPAQLHHGPLPDLPVPDLQLELCIGHADMVEHS
jgi:hypothetical protein